MSSIGIVVAMQPEAACLTALLPRPGNSIQIGSGLILHLCGIGPERAMRAAQQLAAEGVAGLMSFGTAGGLVHGLASGAILIPEQVETSSGSLYTHPGWRIHVQQRLTAIGMHIAPGNMTNADQVVSTAVAKAALGAERNAAGVDMESAAVLQIAAQNRLPALVMRVVVDPLHMELPGFLLKRTDMYGRANLAGVLLDLVRAPTRLPALLQLHGAFRAATQTMHRVGKQLHDLHPGHDVLIQAR